jgi:hypothetical protein
MILFKFSMIELGLLNLKMVHFTQEELYKEKKDLQNKRDNGTITKKEKQKLMSLEREDKTVFQRFFNTAFENSIQGIILIIYVLTWPITKTMEIFNKSMEFFKKKENN